MIKLLDINPVILDKVEKQNSKIEENKKDEEIFEEKKIDFCQIKLTNQILSEENYKFFSSEIKEFYKVNQIY